MFFSGKLSRSHITFIKRVLGFRAGSFPFTYLGVPICIGALSALILQPIADKIRGKLISWKGKILSYVGRDHLIRSVLESTLTYSFRVYKWPSTLFKKIRGRCRNFLWASDREISKHAIVS